jgi:hypothetical protein
MRAVDSLTAARDLYAAAEYEDALALLDRLQPGNHDADERRSIEQYRAYCLLALGRSADAERAIAAVVTAMPLYKPSGTDVSPRVRSAFSAVRRRMLPSIVQEKYTAAKAAFDRKNFAVAAAGFAEVVDALSDADMADVFNQSPLSDLRVLAIGFRDLSASAAAPAPLQARAATPAVATMAVTTAIRIYNVSDANVIPPVSVRQVLPPIPAEMPTARRGVLDLVITETGAVESAVMRESVNPAYDTQAVAAALEWRYKPATLRGVPVKYRKMLQVTVTR